MNNISELIVAISTALIPIVFAWIGKVLANNKKALSLLYALMDYDADNKFDYPI